MKRNYLLVYKNRLSGNCEYRYFEEKEDMNKFIKENLNSKYWEVLHKYKIEEI